MTVLATTMGCSFLIVLASIGFGLQDSLVEEASSHQPLTQIDIIGKQANDEFEPMTDEWINNVRNTENIRTVVTRSQIHEKPVEITFNEDYSGSGNVTITDFEAEKESNFRLSAGRFPENNNEIIVGYHFKEFLHENAEEGEQMNQNEEGSEPRTFEGEVLNETITLNMQEPDTEELLYQNDYKIVGIAVEPTRDWLSDYSLYIGEDKREELIALAGQEDRKYTDVIAHVNSVEQVENTTNALKDEGFTVFSISEELKGLNMFFTAFKAGLIFVGTIAVFIASIGIFNTMTMAVTERTHEIGVMKALGANPASIKRMFLMESASIGIIGSIFGVLIAYIVSIGANALIPMILEATTESQGFDITFSYIPIQLVLIATAISIAVAMISGFRPAAKATRINVLNALRREA